MDGMNILIHIDDGLIDEMCVIIVHAESGFSAGHFEILHKADACVICFLGLQSLVHQNGTVVSLGIVEDKSPVADEQRLVFGNDVRNSVTFAG